ncbi:unnamed protein product [Parajaminaea phylloscopi]
MVAFYARRPELKLTLSEDTAALTSSLQKKYERKVANDAIFLPKSTNMGLPAYVSTGEKYNYEDADEAVSKVVASSPPKKTPSFKRSIPCFFVPHVPAALPWYKEVLGFSVVGKPDAGRAELYRASPGSSSPKQAGTSGVSLYLRKPPADADGPSPKGSLWIEVDNIDDLFQEIMHRMSIFAQDLTDYFPAHHFGSSKVVSKPRNTGFGERQMTVVDDSGNTIIFFQALE